MTETKRLNPLNISNFSGFAEPKINKRYQELPSTKEVLNALPAEPKHDVGFDKPDQTITFDVPPHKESVASPTETISNIAPETTDAEKREERRASFKRAADIERKAQQEMKLAKEKLAEANKFQQLMSLAKTDPTAVARALNMDPTEFLRVYQNHMFNIPNEVKPEPKEDMEARFNRYEQERRQEKEEILKMKSQSIKQDYITSRILPVIMQDQDKFELLNHNGREQCAAFIYDMMNAHFQNTGEELNAADVAEEMENQLVKELQDKIVVTRKLKKFSKHFRTDTDAPGEEIAIPGQLEADLSSTIEVRTSAQTAQQQANQLGAVAANDTSLNTKLSQGPSTRVTVGQATAALNPAVAVNTSQRQSSLYKKKEDRIRKIEEYATKQGIVKNY